MKVDPTIAPGRAQLEPNARDPMVQDQDGQQVLADHEGDRDPLIVNELLQHEEDVAELRQPQKPQEANHPGHPQILPGLDGAVGAIVGGPFHNGEPIRSHDQNVGQQPPVQVDPRDLPPIHDEMSALHEDAGVERRAEVHRPKDRGGPGHDHRHGRLGRVEGLQREPEHVQAHQRHRDAVPSKPHARRRVKHQTPRPPEEAGGQGMAELRRSQITKGGESKRR
mmetsp:Transcript_13106/g.37401  ORF Transcript_13106/g.37401 Transcript_13106/m.37401 type:complete len:223 (+) Transcript_13106:1375-2043(+)